MSTVTRQQVDVGARIVFQDGSGLERRGTVDVVQERGVLARPDGSKLQLLVTWDRVISVEATLPGLDPVPAEAPAQAAAISREILPGGVAAVAVPIQDIQSFRFQPREFREEDATAVATLAEDIRVNGLLAPVIVREIPNGPKPYELIAGERRLRACQLLGMSTILALNHGQIDDKTAARFATSENAARRDLNPMDVARNIRYLDQLGFTQTEIGQLLGGKSQEWVSERRRLIGLPAEAQQLLKDGRLTASHGVRLLRFLDVPKACVLIAQLAADQQASTRQLEGPGIPFAYELQQAGLLHDLKRALEPPPSLDLDSDDPAPEAHAAATTTLAAPQPADQPAAAPQPEAAAAPKPVKPGALKSAEELARERAEARQLASGEAPKPQPVQTIIPGALAEEMKAHGVYPLQAFRDAIRIAKVARKAGGREALLDWLEKLVDLATQQPVNLAREDAERLGKQVRSIGRMASPELLLQQHLNQFVVQALEGGGDV